MIKYAVMTFMYSGWVNSDKGSHEGLIDILAESGADGIEAFCNHFMGHDELVQLYQRKMAASGLLMPVMDLIANLAAAPGTERQEAYENMRQGIDICDALNSEIVHLAGCSLPEGMPPAEGRKWIAEGLLTFADEVARRGMVLAFEDFNPAPDLICSSADCLDILNQTGGRVKFVFDTGNFLATGESAEDVFDLLFDHSCHFHFKDFAHPDPGEEPRICRGTHFGRGRTNNAEVIRKMTRRGYAGWVALESYPQDGSGPERVIPVELASLQKLFAEA